AAGPEPHRSFSRDEGGDVGRWSATVIGVIVGREEAPKSHDEPGRVRVLESQRTTAPGAGAKYGQSRDLHEARHERRREFVSRQRRPRSRPGISGSGCRPRRRKRRDRKSRTSGQRGRDLKTLRSQRLWGRPSEQKSPRVMTWNSVVIHWAFICSVRLPTQKTN